MKSSCLRAAAVAVSLGLSIAAASQARAADVAAPVKAPVLPAPHSAWTFELTPYLWAAGINGDVAVGPAAQNISAGQINRLLQAIKRGRAYVNVHTTGFPSGEIRGQLSSVR